MILFLFFYIDLEISPDDLKQLCLVEIDRYLKANGKCLADYKCMPQIHDDYLDAFGNLLISNELAYDRDEMFLKHTELFEKLNEE
jgi:hypothetical protein